MGNDKLFILYYPYRSILYNEMQNIFNTVKSILPDNAKLLSIPDIVSLKKCSIEELERIKAMIEELLSGFYK